MLKTGSASLASLDVNTLRQINVTIRCSIETLKTGGASLASLDVNTLRQINVTIRCSIETLNEFYTDLELVPSSSCRELISE